MSASFKIWFMCLHKFVLQKKVLQSQPDLPEVRLAAILPPLPPHRRALLRGQALLPPRAHQLLLLILLILPLLLLILLPLPLILPILLICPLPLLLLLLLPHLPDLPEAHGDGKPCGLLPHQQGVPGVLQHLGSHRVSSGQVRSGQVVVRTFLATRMAGLILCKQPTAPTFRLFLRGN